jgi:hypothetical protein
LKSIIIGFILFWASSVSAVRSATSDEYYKAGLQLYQQRQYDQAIKYFEAAVRSDTENWQAFQTLGLAFYQKNKIDDAVRAFDKSLRIHSENAPLKAFADQLRNRPVELPVPMDTPQVSVSSPPSIHKVLAQSHFFLKGEDTFALSSLGDLARAYLGGRGVTALTNESTTPQGPYGTYGSEFGYEFDNFNAVSFSWETEITGTFILNSEDNSVLKTFTPIEYGYSLNYYRFMPDGNGRWIGRIGVGYYNVNMNASDTTSGLGNVLYPLSGNAIGASISVEREVMLFWVVGLDLSVGFKYADVSQLTGLYPGGTLAFYKDSTGYIGLADNKRIGTGGLQYGSTDFSGFNFGFGLEFDF